jgi:hypothetical protein
MNVITTIYRAKMDFMSRTGQTPTHVLLSPEAANVADEEFDRATIYKLKPSLGKVGRTIHGLELLYVDNIEGVKVALL